MEDPLGAVPQVVNITTLERWNTTVAPDYDIQVEDPSNMKTSPFTYNEEINKKIVLWSGDVTQLNVEALVNSTNESMNDKNPLTEHIIKKAGPDLRRDIKTNIKSCRTGDAKLSKAYQLPARYVIHTVGPRYNIRYKTAAESALFSSYRSVLRLLRENNIRSLGLGCIHSMRRGYPPFEGAHIGIRAVRRFLEKFGEDIDLIVFIATGDNEDIYLSLLPLYFPRTKCEEVFGAYHLPYDVGDEMGEPVVPDRQIRIQANPCHDSQDPLSMDRVDGAANISEVFETSVAVGAHEFSKMQGDIDRPRQQRLQHKKREQLIYHQQQKRYDHWLKRARQEDLSDIASLRCLYQSGFDRHGRAVIVFVGRNFPSSRIPVQRALMYFITTLDAIVEKGYVVVYLHTLTTAENQPDTEVLKQLYGLVDNRYRKNLGAIYMVHTGFWSKIMTWFFTTFGVFDLRSKVHHIPGLEYLYRRIPPDQLDLPRFVTDYDLQENGTRYYDPEEDEAIGSL